MGDSDDVERARRAYEKTANDPDVKRDRPPPGLEPGSHSTGGAHDHAEPGEGEPPVARDKVHRSAPAMDRKREPMVTHANPPPRTGRPGVHRTLDTGLPPDEDT